MTPCYLLLGIDIELGGPICYSSPELTMTVTGEINSPMTQIHRQVMLVFFLNTVACRL
jgi:hypothetical protein